MPHAADVDVTPGQISALASADAVAAFLTTLGYDTAARTPLTPEAIGLAGDSAAAIKSIEVMAEDPEGLLRVVFVHLRSLTAKGRNDLARVLARSNVEYLLILTSDFSALEFVLIDKRRRDRRGPDGVERLQIVPLAFAVPRKAPATRDLRILRRLTWTCRDGLEQFDKLKNLFQAAAFSEDYFCNRALFADHYLLTRLREDAAWADNPNQAFRQVKDLLRDATQRWRGQGEPAVRADLYEPIFRLLGFKPQLNKPAGDDQTKPDYLLSGEGGEPLTAAFVYAWDRWLDGPDYSLDEQTPDENPGASVVTALEQGLADWIIVTNGRQWRVYSRQAHSRATNFYEVDLPEALIASGDTDPNEAFRYWWLFFRAAAFRPVPGQPAGCWLDQVAEGSRDYAKGLGERLKERIFETIFPHLAQGLLDDRKKRLGSTTRPSDAELRDTFEATLTLLYRLLFLLYAESRDLVPIRESAYREASLKRIKEEIAEAAGVAESEVDRRLDKAYSASDTGLYDRLQDLFAAMDRGSAKLNVPTYNGGLFLSKPSTPSGPPDTNPTRQREASRPSDDTNPTRQREAPPDNNPTRQREASRPGDDTPTRQREAHPATDHDIREQRIARFLLEHKVPDRFLAKAIDRLARDPDDKTFKLAFIDYKSLEVRHLGSIYEGLLEFKLKVAAEDLATKTEKKRERYIPLSAAKARRGREAEVAVPKGSVYLSNDKAERKASGSYYTPDPIVEYIVQQTVGPVLAEKLEALRPEFRKVRKTFDNELQKARAYPVRTSGGEPRDPRQFALQKTYVAHKELVERLFEFRCLDPAMGSGHFLVEAVDFITDQLLTFLNQFPINPVTFMLEETRRNILEALGEQGVSVEPAKLTDINLLKRHVLKRCIYGVDLNPMAVELAKVSLWLDAFTLGAPLSFLDHHLRCGNSLVGATFADLKAAAKGTLFGIDYEPLLRAIQHVLVVNKMADATAAEVRRSASEYSQARDELSGYQIVLDLLVARHFGYPNAPGLLEHGRDLDLASRARFMKSLVDLEELALVERVEELSRQPDRRFFHWEIEFPEVFFSFADAGQRHLKHKDELVEGSAGFDAVVGNPPYDVLAEKELEADLGEVLGYFKSERLYAPALGGKQNLYKLFICRNAVLARQDGRVGHIVPMALLGDEQALGVRKMLLGTTSIRAIEAFPQKDDPSNRVFEEAKLSTCIFVTARSSDDQPFRSRVHPGKDIEQRSPSQVIRRNDVALYDPDNQPIVACSQEDWDLATRIMSGGRMARLGEFCKAFQGEVNETTDGEKGNISDSPKDGPQVLRGSNICLYVLRPPSQGEAIYLRRDRYLKDKKPGAKAWHHQHRRVGIQESCPQNNFRRIIASLIPPGEFCNHKINYFPEPESQYPLELLLGILNSKLIDWFFRLGSTSASVSHYQLYVLPAPRFADDSPCTELSKDFRRMLVEDDANAAFDRIADLLAEPPFPCTVRDCIVATVNRIIDIERGRGDIARAERSALAPAAQPLQDLLDRMIYRMAGLSDGEARTLELRLATML